MAKLLLKDKNAHIRDKDIVFYEQGHRYYVKGQGGYRSVTTIVKNVNTLSHSEYLASKYLKKNCLPTPKNKLPEPIPVSGPCISCGGSATKSGTKGTNCGD